MNKKRIWLPLLLLFVIGCTVTGIVWWRQWRLRTMRLPESLMVDTATHWGPTFGATSRQEWIERTVEHLRAFVPKSSSRRPQLHFGSGDSFEFWLEGTGLAEFQDGNWVYVVVHSFHQGLRDEIYDLSDMAIAIDNKGGLWQCDAHA